MAEVRTPLRGGARRAVVTGSLAVLLAAGCGGDGSEDGTASPQESSASRVAVIRAWADALRAGHVTKATSYFAVPVTVSNGTPPIRLDTPGEVRAFNATLPCGGRLLRTFSSGRYITAEFVLTERPGKGRCGTGTGQKARTTFVVRGGKIVQWRRVSAAPPTTGPIV